MSLVNSSTLGLLRAGMFELISVGGWRVPEAGVVDRRHTQILSDILDPSGYSVYSLTPRENKRYLGYESDKYSQKFGGNTDFDF